MPLFVMISGFLYKTEYDALLIKDYTKILSNRFLHPSIYFLFLNIFIEVCIFTAHNKSDYGYEILQWTKGAITGIDKYG